MGRRKIRTELQQKEKRRIETFNKRKFCLMKKAYELSTLCNIPVCMIVFGPQTDASPAEPVIWPENSDEVRRIIDMYKAKKDRKRTVDLSDFNKNRKKKIENQIVKARQQNEEAKGINWEIENLSVDALTEVLGLVDSKIETVKSKIEGNGLDRNKREMSLKNQVQVQPNPVQYSSDGQDAQFLPFDLDPEADLSPLMLLGGYDCLDIGNASVGDFFQRTLPVQHNLIPPSVKGNSLINNNTGLSSSMQFYDPSMQMQSMVPLQCPVLPSYASSYGLQSLPQIYGGYGNFWLQSGMS